MARTLSAHFAVNNSATAGNLNGGGFNPYNANFPTDLATTTGTSATPAVSSATYTFVNGTDANAWVYVKSGTNWIQGFYKISSVSGGVATLDAAIGAAVVWDSTTGKWIPSTVQGCATQNTPGGNATYGVDYSQTTAAPWAAVADLASTTGTTNPSTVSSATVGFATNHLGNFIHITAGTNWTVNGTSTAGLQSWYEIVSVAAGVATLSDNQAVGTSATLSSGTFYLGGALSLGSSTANRTDDAAFELGGGTNGSPGTIFWIKNATYSTISAPTIAAAGGTQAPAMIIGYSSVRGDNPTGSTRPIFNIAAGTFAYAANWETYFIQFLGTGTSIVQMNTSNKIVSCKVTNTSTTAGRNAILVGNSGANPTVRGCEAVSYLGRACANSGPTAGVQIMSSYLHDSDIGYLDAGTTQTSLILYNIIAENTTTAIHYTAAHTGTTLVQSNTIYGSNAKMGTGILYTTGCTNVSLIDNIISGFVTGVVHPDVQTVGADNYNDYYNNTVDVAATAGGASDPTRWQKGANDSVLDPTFTNVLQYTGTGDTATVVLTDAGASFGTLVPGEDFLYVTGGGATAGIYGIVSNNATTITVDNTLGTHSGVSYTVYYKHNYAIGTNLKALGNPGVFPGALTTGYLDIGAVQRQETGGGGATSYTFGG